MPQHSCAVTAAYDVRTAYSKKHRALIAWSQEKEKFVRLFGCSVKPTSYKDTRDSGKSTASEFPGRLSNKTLDRAGDPVGIMHLSRRLRPGQSTSFSFKLSFSTAGRASATRRYAACPDSGEALRRTRAHYDEILGRAVVVTPDSDRESRGLMGESKYAAHSVADAHRMELRQRPYSFQQ